MSKKSKVIIPEGMKQPPTQSEKEAALLLANQYKTNVTFIPTDEWYEIKSADIHFLRKNWEIKTFTSRSHKTIRFQIRKATKQSLDVIIDIRASSITPKSTQAIIKTTRVRDWVIINSKNEILDNFTIR